MTTGAIYIATGASFLREAIVSAKSLKQVHPELPVTVFTDLPVEESCFDTVVRVERHLHNFDHVIHMGSSPYDKTLYLDTDTIVRGDILECFALLDRFDLAAAQDTRRQPAYAARLFAADPTRAPLVYPQHSACVVLFRKGPRMDRFFGAWLENYRRDQAWQDQGIIPFVGDQVGFREALYRSELDIGVLPAEYCCRATFPGGVDGDVRIVHCRHAKLSAIADTLNGLRGRRVHFVQYGKLRVINQEGEVRTLRLEPVHRFWAAHLRRKLRLAMRRGAAARLRGAVKGLLGEK
jgi:hypothetical protein